MEDLREILPDPVLQNVGRHLSLAGMRTCRLVCKRWAVVIGESVAAIGAGADALREAVLRGDGRSGALALGGRRRPQQQQQQQQPGRRPADELESDSEGLSNDGGSGSGSGDDDYNGDDDGAAASAQGRRRANARAAMRRLRRQSARLARAFPRAHTAALFIDVGYGGRAAPDPAEAAGRVACLLSGLPNLSRVRLAVRALGADDGDAADDPDAALDNDYTFTFTLQFLSHLLLRAPPHEARALPPTAAALRRRRAMLPGVPWGGAVPPSRSSSGGVGGGAGSGGGAEVAAAYHHHHHDRHPPCWALELHLGARPADPAAWADLAALPQLATLLLPAQQPRLPAAALPALAACTGLRALRLSVEGGGGGGGVLGDADVLAAHVAALSRLTALTHLALHVGTLPSQALSAAIASLQGLRDLFVSGLVPLDVAVLVRPSGLTALERLALPQPLTLAELCLLRASCARLRHIEAAGVWEACLGELSETSSAPDAAAGGEPSPVRALLALPSPHAAEEEAAGPEADLLAAPAAAGAAAAGAWFQTQRASARAWETVLADGWAALTLPEGAPEGAPTDPWAALNTSENGGGGDATPAAQLALLVGVTRTLHRFSESPHEVAQEAGILSGLRLRECTFAGCSVSAIAVLAAALASVRHPGAAAAYDPAEFITLTGPALPASAADGLLDGLNAADAPEPPSGSEIDSDDYIDSSGSDEGGAGQSHGDSGSSEKGGGPSAPPARTRRRTRRAGQRRGVKSFFTWAGMGADLGPLGDVLGPHLERLSVALPPSISAMAAASVSSNQQWPYSLPELQISFGGPSDGNSGSSGSSISGGDGGRFEGADGLLPPPPPAAPAAASSAATPFANLRHLSIGSLTTPAAQHDPACSVGDAALRAIAAGLPALEALQLDGDLAAVTGAGLARLGALTRLRSLALHHWTDTLLPLGQQLVRVPALSLPPGLTSLRAIHVQLDPPPPHASAGGRTGAPPQQGDADALARVFGRMTTLELAHGDHAAADRLLELALPRMATSLEALHVSGPCAFRHTPARAAFAYGAAFGAEAATGFALPWAQWLAGLRGGGSAASGATWLRHIAGLRALADVHIDAPLASPAQVRELVDALVRRGGVNALAVHGLTVSLVTRRPWLVQQLARLAPLGVQSVSISFGRHALAIIPGWLRPRDARTRAAQQQQQPCPADLRMLEALAAAFKWTPDAHFTIATDDGLEESAHTVPWGLPLPQQQQPQQQQQEQAGGGAGGGPIAEGAEAAGAAAQPPPPPPPAHHDEDGEPRLPRGLRVLARVLAFCIGPRNAVEMLSRALLPAMVGDGGGAGAEDGGGGGGVPAAWGVHAMVVDAISPACEPDRCDFPDGVLNLLPPSLATLAFFSGALLSLSVVAVVVHICLMFFLV